MSKFWILIPSSVCREALVHYCSCPHFFITSPDPFALSSPFFSFTLAWVFFLLSHLSRLPSVLFPKQSLSMPPESPLKSPGPASLYLSVSGIINACPFYCYLPASHSFPKPLSPPLTCKSCLSYLVFLIYAVCCLISFSRSSDTGSVSSHYLLFFFIVVVNQVLQLFLLVLPYDTYNHRIIEW